MPRRFDFVSPGVQLTEIDESQLEAESTDEGALIIGTARSGPGMRPVRVRSKAHLFDVFGEPSSGVAGADADVWRDGNLLAPTYALYAAQAWLASETSPVTFVRLLGNDQKTSLRAAGYTYAGWNLGRDTIDISPASGQARHNVMAYGLFLVPSSSTGIDPNTQFYNTGTLGAVIYASGSALSLSGTFSEAVLPATSSACAVIESVGTNAGFKIEVWDDTSTFPGSAGAAGAPLESFVVDFDYDGAAFIRNVMNTNPQRLDSSNFGSSATKKYWVGQTYERSVANKVTSVSSSAGDVHGILIPLVSGSAADGTLAYYENQREAQPAKTGWFTNKTGLDNANRASFNARRQQKLFRLVSLSEGEYFQNKYYVAIEDLKIGNSVNKNSTFSVAIKRYSDDSDIEKFAGLNLDPSSADYISRRIGNQTETWNSTTSKYTISGEHANISDFIRVEAATALENGTITDPYRLPWGFLGPVRPKGFVLVAAGGGTDSQLLPQGSYADFNAGEGNSITGKNVFITGSINVKMPGWPGTLTDDHIIICHQEHFRAPFEFPALELTETGTNSNNTDFLYSDYFGMNLKKATLNSSHLDLLKELPTDSTNAISVHLGEDELSPPYTSLELSLAFSLDDIRYSSTTNKYFWQSGSFEADTSYTVNVSNTADDLLTAGVRQFVAPFFGGTDGVDITKTQPFSNANLSSKSELDHYAFYSIDRMLDLAKEPEMTSYDVISMPGLTNTTLTDKMVQGCQDRGDSLAIIDVAGIYKPKYENSGIVSNGSVSSVITTVKARQLASPSYNSSYGATYYPSLRLTGDDGMTLIVPPSVGALGALAKTDSLKAPWFAPAGFNQGGLSELGGPAGPRVVGVDEVLKKSERDSLYQLNVNPVARLSNQIVIFGQKTLQQTPSALDRVNVRRLMIYIKKRIGDLANTVLFDQNLQATWNRFNAGADKVLSAIQSEYGLEEYKIVLDSSTTTPDLVDRNILYAKIYIKPARSIEFIAVDFVITRSGIEL